MKLKYTARNFFDLRGDFASRTTGTSRRRATRGGTTVLLLSQNAAPCSSENLSVVPCFRRVSRGNAARRPSQATKTLLPPSLSVFAALLTVSSRRRCSLSSFARTNGERKDCRRENRPIGHRPALPRGKYARSCNRRSHGGASDPAST